MSSEAPARPPLPAPLAVPVYDNHTHLDPHVASYLGEVLPEAAPGETPGLESALAELDSAQSVGVAGVVQVGTDLDSSRWSARLAAADARVLAAVALHPNDAPRYAERGELMDALEQIDALASEPRVRAVGETGLDYFRTGEDGRAAQHESFEAHIDIAKRHGVALQIHDRDAHDDVVATLDRVGAPAITVLHCFSGGPELALAAAERGWFVSFSGTVTFRNAREIRESLALVPRERILVETDAPFLTPHPYRGRPNAPYLVPVTLRTMAELLDEDPDALAADVAANSRAAYGSWDDDTEGSVSAS